MLQETGTLTESITLQQFSDEQRAALSGIAGQLGNVSGNDQSEAAFSMLQDNIERLTETDASILTPGMYQSLRAFIGDSWVPSQQELAHLAAVQHVVNMSKYGNAQAQHLTALNLRAYLTNLSRTPVYHTRFGAVSDFHRDLKERLEGARTPSLDGDTANFASGLLPGLRAYKYESGFKLAGKASALAIGAATVKSHIRQ